MLMGPSSLRFFKELSRSQEAADLIKLEHSVIRVRSFPPRSRPRPTLHRRVDSRIWVAATIPPTFRNLFVTHVIAESLQPLD